MPLPFFLCQVQPISRSQTIQTIMGKVCGKLTHSSLPASMIHILQPLVLKKCNSTYSNFHITTSPSVKYLTYYFQMHCKTVTQNAIRVKPLPHQKSKYLISEPHEYEYLIFITSSNDHLVCNVEIMLFAAYHKRSSLPWQCSISIIRTPFGLTENISSEK